MAFFIARRLLYLLPVLIAVSLLTFSISSLLPGDLAYTILADQATPENLAALRRDMGLDQPIWMRYFSWLGHVLQGDFGRSFRTGQTVLQAVSERLPVSFELMILAEIMCLVIGIPLAIICAARNGGPFDRFMTGTAFGMLSLVTITGINIGRLIGGAVIVETIFALPGIGRLLVGAIGTRDLIILQGVVLLVGAGFVLLNFIVDMLYAALDPRIRHGHA